jgi:hypothetical protein
VEITLARATCKDWARTLGYTGLLVALEAAIAAPPNGVTLELFYMSQDWAHDDSTKIIKCKGARGDLIVYLT